MMKDFFKIYRHRDVSLIFYTELHGVYFELDGVERDAQRRFTDFLHRASRSFFEVDCVERDTYRRFTDFLH